LGFEVDIEAGAISVLSAVVRWIWENAFSYTSPIGFAGAITNLFTAVAILMTTDSVVKGFNVNGFGGAIVSTLTIAIVA